MMDQYQISNMMGMIYHKRKLLEVERDKRQKELDQFERCYEEVKHLFPDSAHKRQLECMNNRRKYIDSLNRAIFGLRESWNYLEDSKMPLIEIESEESNKQS